MRTLGLTVSLALLLLCVNSESTDLSQCPTAQRASFTRKLVRLCLRRELLHEWPLGGPDATACATLCVGRGVRCRGFRLTSGDGGSVCQTMEFDRCSYMPNQDGCSLFGWAFVRSQEGLPSGQLCPADYGNGFRSSSFKMVSVSSWTDGLNKCNSDPGLTKFADGIDRPEIEHIRTLMPIYNGDLDSNRRSFYLGGFRSSPFIYGTWFWHDCNFTLLPEVWGAGQPNGDGLCNRTNVWYSHTYGLDDAMESVNYLIRALCECVNPFD